MTSTAWVRTERRVGSLRIAALALIGIGAALIALLHVIPPTSSIDVIHVTISEYGRTALAPVFATAVILIALGSLCALALFVHAGECRIVSMPSAALLLWVVGMIGVALFPKADWSTGATLSGEIHRAASIIAFVGLAIAIITLVWGDRVPNALTRARPPRRMSQRARTVAAVCAATASAAMIVLAVYVAVSEARQVEWWTILPLGLLERLLVVLELTGLVALIVTTRPRL